MNEDAAPTDLGPETSPQTISWTASEYVAHDKSTGWYLTLAGAAAVISVVVFLISRDAVSVGVVIVAALLLGVYGAREPRQLEYSLDQRGVTIGEKSYGYHEFRSFSVVPEGAFSSVTFMPLKRFATPTSIYYAPEDEEKILNVLSSQLPYDQHRRDAVDNLMRRIRF